MITIKTVLLASVKQEGMVVTEDACKAFIQRFEKRKEPLIVYGGNSTIPVGIVIKVEYDPTKRTVIGYINLNLQFAANVNILKALDIPNEKRIVDCDINKINLNIGEVNAPNRGTEKTVSE